MAVQFALIVGVIAAYRLESPSFQGLAALALVGFILQTLLPLRARLAGFTLLSVLGIGLVMGAAAGAWVVGLGLVLVALCRLPGAGARSGPRIAVVVLAGIALAAGRAGWLPVPWPPTVWAVFGSLFMFRTIVYLYDLRHERIPPGLWESLAYFFLLPNVCFPLFPVVDFKTFRTSYHAEDLWTGYQRGVRWMARGLVHLVAYRVVYYYWTLAPGEVETAADLTRFLLSNILLYLRVSGQFHLAVGMLRLFGFHLPETNHRYFLASSFTEYWRRINIYWKDFMMKVFYYPLYIRLHRRRWSKKAALVAATAAVFLVSWLLHSYQWFWLQGTFPLRLLDALFWGTVGVLVLMASLRELGRRQRRSLGSHSVSLRQLVSRSLSTMATFSALCVLWSLWTSESLEEWLSMWRVEGMGDGRVLALSAGLLLAFGLMSALERPGGGAATDRGPATGRAFWRSAVATAGLLVALLAVTRPVLQGRLGAASGVLADLRRERLNRRDAEVLERGYYEKIQVTPRFESPLWEIGGGAPAPGEVPADSELFQPRQDALWLEIRPGVVGTYLGKPFHANRWGMRDRDYPLAKPADTVRLAVLGGSHVMGHGVADGEVFADRLEVALNRRPDLPRRYEVLNFAVDDFSPLQDLWMLEQRVFRFAPDVVLYVAHTADRYWVGKHMARMLARGTPFPDAYLAAMAEAAGIDDETPARLYESHLREASGPVLEWTYRRIVEACRQHGAQPVWVFLPKLREHGRERLIPWLRQAAEEAGFEVIMLTGVFDGHERGALKVGPSDFHPNALAHRLIAERLEALLVERPELLGAPGGD